MSAWVVAFDFFEWFLPVAHFVFPVVILDDLLQMFSVVRINNDIAKFFFGLNPISLLDVFYIDIYFQVNIDRIEHWSL